MDDDDNNNKQSDHHKPSRGPTKLPVEPTSTATATTTLAPCGACKFLRRKCVAGCIFAPHFGSDQGGARFAAVHKVFGASNVSKLLQHVPVARRHDAVVTICYEAQARLADPVYGCVSTILSLQHQVASLQAELSMVQLHLINSKLAVANALHGGAQQNAVLQPGYSNASAASNNESMMSLTSCFPASASFDLSVGSGLPSSRGGGSEAVQLSQPPSSSTQDEDEEESQNPVAVAFANGVLNPPK